MRACDVARVAATELEEWEAEERAEEHTTVQAQSQVEVQPTGDPTSLVPEFDWSSVDVSALPASWLQSPPPLDGPGSSGGIPPTSQDNSNS